MIPADPAATFARLLDLGVEAADVCRDRRLAGTVDALLAAAGVQVASFAAEDDDLDRALEHVYVIRSERKERPCSSSASP